MSGDPRRLAKRALDLVVGFAALALTGPLLLGAMLLVRLSSPGPIFFRQTRIGRGGRPFTLLKLRTMTCGPRPEPAVEGVRPGDPRLTPVGGFLRRWSLDELPQLLNVLRGDMSLVGPRPDLPHHVEGYSAFQRRRLEVRPGITGWAQIHGRNRIPWEERIVLDVDYVRRWSLLLDLIILTRTPFAVLSGRGVYDPPAGGMEKAKRCSPVKA